MSFISSALEKVREFRDTGYTGYTGHIKSLFDVLTTPNDSKYLPKYSVGDIVLERWAGNGVEEWGPALVYGIEGLKLRMVNIEPTEIVKYGWDDKGNYVEQGKLKDIPAGHEFWVHIHFKSDSDIHTHNFNIGDHYAYTLKNEDLPNEFSQFNLGQWKRQNTTDLWPRSVIRCQIDGIFYTYRTYYIAWLGEEGFENDKNDLKDRIDAIPQNATLEEKHDVINGEMMQWGEIETDLKPYDRNGW